ncbi:MAG: class 1 isoprenoid biosynthesis enzyme [Bacteroidota bacterium]|nr:class 1 isoprenoid biosynthesis enzyme [Bacteroidota bacterium]
MRSYSDRQAKEMRNRVFRHMLKKRGWKYKVFLRYLCFFKYAAFAPVRGRFLESYYTLMRYLDDVVDGDAPLPQPYHHESDYVADKIRFSENPEAPNDEVDFLMAYCFELAERFGADFKAETKDILESLFFDAQRRGKLMIFPQEVLNHHFHLLDIRGTIRATLKVFREDPEQYPLLEPLGMACRYQYDIEDYEADIAAGYVNISQEECDLFGILHEDLDDTSSPGVKAWLHHRAKEGMKLLEEHHRLLRQGKFSWLSRGTFRFVYEMPARKVFRHILLRP